MNKVKEIIETRKKFMTRENKNGYKGIRQERNGRYRATFVFRANNSTTGLSLGTYDTPEEARNARNKFINSLK